MLRHMSPPAAAAGRLQNLLDANRRRSACVQVNKIDFLHAVQGLRTLTKTVEDDTEPGIAADSVSPNTMATPATQHDSDIDDRIQAAFNATFGKAPTLSLRQLTNPKSSGIVAAVALHRARACADRLRPSSRAQDYSKAIQYAREKDLYVFCPPGTKRSTKLYRSNLMRTVQAHQEQHAPQIMTKTSTAAAAAAAAIARTGPTASANALSTANADADTATATATATATGANNTKKKPKRFHTITTAQQKSAQDAIYAANKAFADKFILNGLNQDLHAPYGPATQHRNRNKPPPAALKTASTVRGASWNGASINARALDTIADFGYDFICLQETHSHNKGFLKRNTPRRHFSAPAPKSDPAAGTAILLSARLAKCVAGSGHCGSRINWVRIRTAGPALFIVSAYIPHNARKAPSRDDTFIQLEELLSKVPSHDNLIVCMDANCKLQKNVAPHTGPHGVHDRADAGGNRLMGIMQTTRLTAINTKFKPRGNQHRCNRRRRRNRSKPDPYSPTHYNLPKPNLNHNATFMPLRCRTAPSQIDYVLMSTRWSTGAKNCRVKWDNCLWKFGRVKYDHGLIEFEWKCRLKTKPKPPVKPDYTALKIEATRRKFNAVVNQLLFKTEKSPPPTVGKMTIYTDGGERNGKAGWGALVLDKKTTIEASLYGPIITDDQDLLSCLAKTHTNNTGELTAIIEALLYVLYIDKTNRAVEIIYDSTLAGNLANGTFCASANIETAHLARRLFRLTESRRGHITTTHVFSHTTESDKLRPGDHKYVAPIDRKWNDEVDELATKGLRNADRCRQGRFILPHGTLTDIKELIRPTGGPKWDTAATHTTSASTDDAGTQYKKMTAAIRTAAKQTLPVTKPRVVTKRHTSKHTATLVERRAKQAAAMTQEARARCNKELARAGRKDYRDFIQKLTAQIEEANDRGDSKTVYQIVKRLGGRYNSHVTRPTSMDNGDIITDNDAALAEWCTFMEARFKKAAIDTDEPLEDIPSDGRDQCFTREVFETCAKHSKALRATNEDDVPNEAYKLSDTAQEELYNLCKRIWIEEEVPRDLVTCIFVMIFKKGSQDDKWNYRPIGLLSHAYKMLSRLILTQIQSTIEKFLPESQSGFRARRGTRDSTTVVNTLMEHVIMEGRKVLAIFLDFKDAFSTISHKYLDGVLKEVGVSSKMRKLIRSIYIHAHGKVRFRNADGTHSYSGEFDINRGVIQGDIMSPVLFIVGLAAVCRTALTDDHEAKLTRDGTLHVGDAVYADDTALLVEVIQEEDETDTDHRARLLAIGSRKAQHFANSTKNISAMEIRPDKTVAGIVEKIVDPNTKEQDVKDAAPDWAHACPDCLRKFRHKKSIPYHQARWCTKDPAIEAAQARPYGAGSLSAKTTRRTAALELQSTGCGALKIDGEEIKLADEAVHLGCLYSFTGDSLVTTEHRLSIARSQFGKLTAIWKDDKLTTSIKIELYRAAIVSTATYGCEAWKFNDATRQRMNNFNAKALAVITGKTIRDMAKNPPFNIVNHIKTARAKWLGAILRMDPSRELFQMCKETHGGQYDGCIFDIAPTTTTTFEELIDAAQLEPGWNKHIKTSFPHGKKKKKKAARPTLDASIFHYAPLDDPNWRPATTQASTTPAPTARAATPLITAEQRTRILDNKTAAVQRREASRARQEEMKTARSGSAAKPPNP